MKNKPIKEIDLGKYRLKSWSDKDIKRLAEQIQKDALNSLNQ